MDYLEYLEVYINDSLRLKDSNLTLDDTKKKLHRSIRKINPFELLSHLLCYSANLNLFENEVFEAIKKGFQSQSYSVAEICIKHPLPKKCIRLTKYRLMKIVSLLDEYEKLKMLKNTNPEEEKIIRYAKIQNERRKNSTNMYRFQLKDYVENIFYPLNDDYKKKFGFSCKDAMSYEKKIVAYYEGKIEEHCDKKIGKHKREETLKNFFNQINKLTGDKYKSLYLETHFETFKGVNEDLIFKASDLDVSDVEISSFKAYLEHLSLKFAEDNSANNNLTVKPIIKVSHDKYFVPIPKNLFYNLHLIFCSLLHDEKIKQTSLWHKFETCRSDYLENKSFDLLEKQFPKTTYRNLTYTHNDKVLETDILITCGNVILIAEVKGGDIQSGKSPELIECDLKKLIHKAFDQAKRVKKHIIDEGGIFTKADGGKIKVEYNKGQTEIFLLNITLVPLWAFATESGFIKSDELWSTNLFDLEIIIDVFLQNRYPATFFIHYLSKRIGQDIKALSELSCFSEFLIDPSSDITNEYLLTDEETFNEYYANDNKEALPKLKITETFLNAICELEKAKPENYIKMIRELLDVPFSYQNDTKLGSIVK